MPYDGNGNFIRLHSWTQDAANNLNINAGEMDAEDNGFAGGLSNAVTRDGQGKMAVDFLPAVDNTLNLGSALKRWLTFNGVPLNQFVTYPLTAAEAGGGVTPSAYGYPPGHVLRYGTNTTPGTTDMTAALQASINAVGSGGRVIWPNGTYLATAPILAENLRGLTFQVDAGQFGFDGTRIIGQHTGKAILSLVGSLFCQVGPLILEGSATSTPKTGLLCGRSTSASAGLHTFTGTQIEGNFQLAGHYNIASEQNTYLNVVFQPTVAPFAGGLYMAGVDNHGVGGLTGSSMECATFIGGQVGSADTSAGSVGFLLDTGIAMGHINFFNTFFFKAGGQAFGMIQLGQIDGNDCFFPIGFHNCEGEDGGTHPLYGLQIFNQQNHQHFLSGLKAHVRFDTPSSALIYCSGGGTGTGNGSGVYLVGADISTPMAYGSPVAMPGSVLGRCDGCRISLLSEQSPSTIAALNSSTLLTGAPPTIGLSTYSIQQTDYGPLGLGGPVSVSGAVSASGTLTATGAFGVNGAGPAAQVTGFGTPTGNGLVPNFPGASATLVQCSETIAELLVILKNVGLIGA